MLLIDGSQGEGGGQILRTSLALSVITHTPVRIYSIRAGRAKPGLMRQHLTAVQAAARIGGAQVRGAEIGSRDLTFTPGDVQPGDYAFSIGTAGSTMLVLQTILPPLLLAPTASRITLEGGTHNPHAPPFDFLQHAFLPVINQMGPSVAMQLERPGFYPAGGGRCGVTIKPVAKLSPVNIEQRGAIVRRRARAIVAKLPMHVAEREERALQSLGWDARCVEIELVESAIGPGNLVVIEIGSEHVTEVFTGFGQRGKPAETVAKEALDEAREYLAAGVPIGPHLADQLLLPLALAGGGSFVTMPLTRHSRTNIEIIQMFLDVRIDAEQIADHAWRVTIK